MDALKQSGAVGLKATVTGLGSVKRNDWVEVQKPLLTVTVYDPAPAPEISSVVSPLLQRYVNGPAPLNTVKSMLPSLPPAHEMESSIVKYTIKRQVNGKWQNRLCGALTATQLIGYSY